MTRKIIKFLTAVAFTLSLTFATAQPGGGMGGQGGGRGGQQPMDDYSQYARYSDQAHDKVEPIYIMKRFSSYAFVSYDANFLDLRILLNDHSLFLNGVSAGYMGQLHLGKRSPIFMDLGLTASYSACDDESDVSYFQSNYVNDDWDMIEHRRNYNIKFKRFSLSVPLNYGLWLNWNENVAIIPYGGITMQFNLYANSDSTSQVFEYWTDGDGNVEEKFVDDVMESKGNLLDDTFDENWNRFQLGWQIGIRSDIKRKYMIGVEYGADIISVNEDSKARRVTLKAGVAF